MSFNQRNLLLNMTFTFYLLKLSMGLFRRSEEKGNS